MVLVKFWLVASGIYLWVFFAGSSDYCRSPEYQMAQIISVTDSWEYATSLYYEWDVIRGHQRYRWTIWVGPHVNSHRRPCSESVPSIGLLPCALCNPHDRGPEPSLFSSHVPSQLPGECSASHLLFLPALTCDHPTGKLIVSVSWVSIDLLPMIFDESAFRLIHIIRFLPSWPLAQVHY